MHENSCIYRTIFFSYKYDVTGLYMDKKISQVGKLKKICKRCKTEYDDANGYPVCNYCLKLLDNWE